MDLEAIIDFLYCGETNVYQENLDSFFAIGEELQLKGLMGKSDDEERKIPKQKKVPAHRNELNVSKVTAEPTKAHNDNQIAPTSYGTMVLPNNFSGDLKELDNQTTSMMVKTSRKTASNHYIYKCTLCGREAQATNLRNHIEAIHLQGIEIPCFQCDQTFRSRNQLAKHKHYKHNPSTQEML